MRRLIVAIEVDTIWRIEKDWQCLEAKFDARPLRSIVIIYENTTITACGASECQPGPGGSGSV